MEHFLEGIFALYYHNLAHGLSDARQEAFSYNVNLGDALVRSLVMINFKDHYNSMGKSLSGGRKQIVKPGMSAEREISRQ